jgi:hypothetical protein
MLQARFNRFNILLFYAPDNLNAPDNPNTYTMKRQMPSRTGSKQVF